ncbi:hypothetical protein AVEN_50704-1 [Araneus ventricosus]|uniref:Uncharacterized protein n=1 Tax=Araneus ventricosus TaxID=182803 RepID=A0A4Y2SET4_ARAVE|nr:hypothetical protein AVEN_50704-1 [Araneus ventricosus]
MTSARQGIRWEFVDKIPKLSFGDLVLKTSHRKKILFSLRDRLKLLRGDSLLAKPDQGKVMEVVAQSGVSSHFITNGDYTRFSEWRFVHKARTNTLPLNGNRPWDRSGNTGWRRCDECDLDDPRVESL